MLDMPTLLAVSAGICTDLALDCVMDRLFSLAIDIRRIFSIPRSPHPDWVQGRRGLFQLKDSSTDVNQGLQLWLPQNSMPTGALGSDLRILTA